MPQTPTNASDVQLPANAGGPLVDTSQITTSAGVVQRQRISVADAADASAVSAVRSQDPQVSDYGSVVRVADFDQLLAMVRDMLASQQQILVLMQDLVGMDGMDRDDDEAA